MNGSLQCAPTAANAILGMYSGDLHPLARYIRAGGEIGFLMADALADMIEGDSPSGFLLKSVGSSKSARKFVNMRKQQAKYINVGYHYIRMANEYGAGSTEGVLEDTIKRFQIGRSSVFEAVSMVRLLEAREACECLARGVRNDRVGLACKAFELYATEFMGLPPLVREQNLLPD